MEVIEKVVVHNSQSNFSAIVSPKILTFSPRFNTKAGTFLGFEKM
ncbi:hypothetical protein [Okeania sp.]|nr:hypothetical protein [Okeania sp.]MEB3341401.1 hypothetical protein [Okeania sp.]